MSSHGKLLVLPIVLGWLLTACTTSRPTPTVALWTPGPPSPALPSAARGWTDTIVRFIAAGANTNAPLAYAYLSRSYAARQPDLQQVLGGQGRPISVSMPEATDLGRPPPTTNRDLFIDRRVLVQVALNYGERQPTLVCFTLERFNGRWEIAGISPACPVGTTT